MLSYIPGRSGADGWAPAVDERGLIAGARLLRAYHDAVMDWRADKRLGVVRRLPRHRRLLAGSSATATSIRATSSGTACAPVGLLDYEYARVAQPIDDVAYACEYFVPFRDDAECTRWVRYPEPPDRRRRLSLFAEAYGLPSGDGLVEHVITMQQRMRALIVRLAQEGLPRQVDLVRNGFLDEMDARITWSVTHRHLIEPDSG